MIIILFISTLDICIVHMQWLCILHTLHVFIAIILYIIENLELLKLQSFLCKFCLILLNNPSYFYLLCLPYNYFSRFFLYLLKCLCFIIKSYILFLIKYNLRL